MIIFDARNVRANKARPRFNVALGEFLFFTQFAESITNYHRVIISLRRLEGKHPSVTCTLLGIHSANAKEAHQETEERRTDLPHVSIAGQVGDDSIGSPSMT